MAACGLEPKLASRPNAPMPPAPETPAIALMYQVCPGTTPEMVTLAVAIDVGRQIHRRTGGSVAPVGRKSAVDRLDARHVVGSQRLTITVIAGIHVGRVDLRVAHAQSVAEFVDGDGQDVVGRAVGL